MQINGRAIRNPTAPLPTNLWEAATAWIGSHITVDSLLDAALALETFGSVGLVLLGLHRIFLNWTVTGWQGSSPGSGREPGNVGERDQAQGLTPFLGFPEKLG